MTIKLHPAVRSAMASAITTALDAGAGPATLKLYTGSQPASPADAVTSQTLLATLTLSDPCASYSAGVITFGAITQDSSADADGAATWCRLSDSTGAAVVDLDVSNNAGGGAVKLNTTSIVTGGPVAITSMSITLGG